MDFFDVNYCYGMYLFDKGEVKNVVIVVEKVVKVLGLYFYYNDFVVCVVYK